MNFELSEEQLLLQDSVRRFVNERVKPNARVWDREESFPMDVVSELAEMGLMGVMVAEEHGGAGLGASEMAIVVEEIGKGDGSLALTVASHNGLCSSHIRMFGSDEQKQTFLPALASGEKLGAWALTEPNSGSDAGGMLTTAVQEGDDWVLNGSKIFITQGTVGGTYVVLASTDKSKGNHGITAFILDGDTPGFSKQPLKEKLGMRSSDTAVLTFEDVRVSDSRRLGEVGKGFVNTCQILDRGRITIGALALGLGVGAMEAARDYALEREQFGRPIAKFQAIQWKLADMATELDAARLLIHRAAYLCEQGRPFTKEASMCKLFASEAAMRATDEAIQIHGGYGYTAEFPVERLYRDAKLCTIGEGTSEVQRIVIARQLLQGLG
jgi:alkylation response protein AidB-like acyl-CoA dehydrogenase